MRGDGDGWSVTDDGTRRWGRHGAAGLLLRAPGPDGASRVLLQHRAAWSHHGDTWGLPGGARDSHESVVEAALREAEEEAGVGSDDVRVRAELRTAGTDDGWSYTTVLADTPAPLALTPNGESAALAWVAEDEVGARALHPSFALSWPGLRAPGLRLLVDTANVLGSRADGWWRDRAGATTRLLQQVAGLGARTVELPGGGYGWVREVVAVLEGRAREAEGPVGVRVVHAEGSGDDELVRQAAGPGPTLLVTADRGLRERVAPTVLTAGPRLVLDLL